MGFSWGFKPPLLIDFLIILQSKHLLINKQINIGKYLLLVQLL